MGRASGETITDMEYGNTIVLVPLTQTQLDNRRPMGDIPNRLGFRLLAVSVGGTLGLPLHVCTDANGCHYLMDERGTHRLPSAFLGWVKR